jgi:phosphofructokinase-like protein
MTKRVMVLTGGGDCPGLNAVIRAIVKRASQEKNWEVIGSIKSFDGVLSEPTEVVVLDNEKVSGIHFRGGTILKTTTKGGPFEWPVKNNDGTWGSVDISDEMIRKLNYMGVEAVINIGGDGSQRISQKLYEKGLNVIGVPKTIDNDLSATDYTFGFRTAVQVATESLDKLVTTAESHNRIMIMEVMGRDAGWIALQSAVAGGAEVCLIPEIPYDINKVADAIESRFSRDTGFANIVIAEGAKPKGGEAYSEKSDEIGYRNKKYGGVAYKVMQELKEAGVDHDMRVTVLGHLQRGGVPIAFDRILATMFGVKAFELVLEKKFGEMVSYKNNSITSVKLTDAINQYNFIKEDAYILQTARGIGICLGD